MTRMTNNHARVLAAVAMASVADIARAASAAVRAA